MSTTSCTAPVATVSSPPRRAARRTSPAAAFVSSAAVFAVLFVAAGAVSPLFVLDQQAWGFPAWQLTVAVSSYSFALLAALLVTGRLSDHVGRRPVLISALVLELASFALFLTAHDVGLLIAARVVQGLATGLATSALSAAVVEHAPARLRRLAAVITGIAPAGGLGLGALAAGAAAEFSTAATTTVFLVLAAFVLIGLAVIALSRETVTPRAGALASLRPRVVVPAAARRDFSAAVPLIVGAWMTATLFVGLAPSILRGVFGISDELVIGLVAFTEPASAAVASLLLARVPVRPSLLVSGVALIAGAALIVVGIALATLPALLVGGVLGGIGFGAGFSAAIKQIAPHAADHERAGLFSAVYVVAYLAFGLPVLLAGLLIAPAGLLPVAVAFGVVILAASTVGLIAQVRAGRRPA